MNIKVLKTMDEILEDTINIKEEFIRECFEYFCIDIDLFAKSPEYRGYLEECHDFHAEGFAEGTTEYILIHYEDETVKAIFEHLIDLETCQCVVKRKVEKYSTI